MWIRSALPHTVSLSCGRPAGAEPMVHPGKRPAPPAVLAVSAVLSVLGVLTGCAGDAPVRPAPRSPERVRADIAARVPERVQDRAGWAADLYAALTALKIEPGDSNVCAVLAITEQESTFRVDPPVPNLPKIAREEIFRRADAKGVPALAVRMALQLKSPNGRTYDDRLDTVRTEGEMSLIYEDLIDELPLGKRLLADFNPVHTGGPMQVSVAFAQAHAKAQPYPFGAPESIRHEVFTRRGGLYFGTAHLLGYPAPYGDQMIYRFADFNAGHYASRNAAFQQAVSVATQRSIDLDGDLFVQGARSDAAPGETEAAVRLLGATLAMSDAEIRRDLERSEGAAFERTDLYAKVFAIAERRGGKPLARAVIPRIVLQSPKITRKLTTEWFAQRVNDRYQRCLASPG